MRPASRSTTVNKVIEGRPHIVDMIKNDEIALVVNTVEEKRSRDRRLAHDPHSALQAAWSRTTRRSRAREAAVEGHALSGGAAKSMIYKVCIMA